jgi:hypothetical protein
MQETMIDLGFGARPVFFDFDGDGLEDIVAGSFGYFIQTGVYDSKLALFRNTGSIQQPEFTLITDDYSELSELQFDGVYPAFGDMDDDNIAEMMIGDEEGRLHLFKDFSGEGNPAKFTLVEPNYRNIDVGETAIPQIVDVNRDGKKDLLVGERSGTLDYFENTGTPEEPEFSSLPTNDFFGAIDMMIECCSGYSAPYFTNDSAGNSILYVGSEKGWLYLYGDIDDNLEGAFTLLDSLDLHGIKVTIGGADMNGDGKEEIIYGEQTGGIGLLKPGTPSFLDVAESRLNNLELKLYPNPVRHTLHIVFSPDQPGKTVSCRIIDLFGREVYRSSQPGINNYTIDMTGFAEGIYIVQLSAGKQKVNRKIIVK